MTYIKVNRLEPQFYLPINKTLLNAHQEDTFYYYYFLFLATDEQYFTFDHDHILIHHNFAPYLNPRICASGLGVGVKRWNDLRKDWETSSLTISDENTTMMPIRVFLDFSKKVDELPRKSKNPYTKLYLWLYFLCHSTGRNEYTISISRLAELVGSSTKLICRRIKDLIDWGFLSRMGKYSAKSQRAYTYFIPLDDVSPLNCTR